MYDRRWPTTGCHRWPGSQAPFPHDRLHAQEQGRITKSVIPEKFAGSDASIGILEAAIAQRTSIAVRPRVQRGRLSTADSRDLDVVQEVHTVVGLRLNGMNELWYVWTKTETPSPQAGGGQWGDTRFAGLRDDVPVPVSGLPSGLPKPGVTFVAVSKGSMIKLPVMTSGDSERLGHP